MKKLFKSVQYWKTTCLYIVAFYCLFVDGCGPVAPSIDELREFEEAGPIVSEADSIGLLDAKFHAGPYRVVVGDILEFQMPAILQVISPELPESLYVFEPYFCRVSDAGTVNLPIIGEMPVVGRRLAEIELSVVKAYYPKYVLIPPAVVCKVSEYEGENARVFTVIGLVKRSDTFPYPPNIRYNLMEALAFAGGLDPVADPRYVKIYRRNVEGNIVAATFKLDKKSLPDTYNVILKPGDVIYVDHTLRTRTNTFLSHVLSIGVGADVRYRRR